MSTTVQPAQAAKSKLYSDRAARPVMLSVNWDGIPASLRALSQWVAWELRWVEKRACWAKVPIDVRGISASEGYSRAKSDTPRTWTTFERVRDAWGRSYGTYTPNDPDGPGFVFKADGGIIGIDGDKCRNTTTGELTDFGRELMRRFPGYWEVSPSGTGIKGVFFGVLEGGRGRKVDFPDGQGCEVYDRGRYFALTGRRLEGATHDLTSCAEQLPAFLSEFFPAKVARTKSAPVTRVRAVGSLAPLDTSEKVRRARSYLQRIEGAVEYQGGDNATFRAACVLVLGFDLSPEQALPLMCEWNQTCSPPWDTSWLWRKLTEADKRSDPRGDLLNAEFRSDRPIGYDGLTPEEVAELVNGIGRRTVEELSAQPVPAEATPDECALYAAHDIDDEINLSRVVCPNKRPVLMEKDGLPFVCDRPCGNGTVCRPCLNLRLYQKTREGNAYLIRTTTLASPTGTDAARTVYAAIVDAEVCPGTTRWNTLTNAVRDRGAERCSVLTEDVGAVAERLGRDPGASRFFLEDNKVEGESGTAQRLWLLSMPASEVGSDTVSAAGVTFRRVSVAAAMRGWFHAVKTVPPAPEDGTFKPHHQSKNWGDVEAKLPTTVKALRPSKFGVRRTTQILNQIGVTAYSIQFDRRNRSEPGVGWRLPEIHSLALTLWLGGVDAPPLALTVDRVASLARHWLPLLPKNLGTGYRVESVLRQHIWHLGLYDIAQELRDADQQDKADELATTEAASLLRALREQYRGREHEATGLLAELLA